MSKAVDQSRLQFLEGCIADYNAMYGTSYVANDNKSFYDYYKDLSKRVKRKEVDILLVVNMFLTGFDAPRLNTLYADKNLKHHGLIQAFSRTNRVFDAKKSHGNVVCYRNLKDATDEALAIFANKNAKASIDEVIGTVIMQPYEDLIEVFRVEVEKLKAIAPDTEAVDGLVKEEDQLDFIVKFRDVLRLQNTLKTFSQFAGELDSGKLGIDEQNLLDYQSKYLDLREDIEAAERDKRRQKVDSGSGENPQPDTPSPIQQILFGIDFQIELIKRDEITVSYILGLIEKLKDQPNEKKFEAGREMILDVLQSNPDLRSKRALFETFIDEELDKIDPAQAAAAEGFVIGKFNEFVEAQKAKALDDICKEFDADCAQLANMYQDFVYRGTLPNRTDLLGILNVKPRITKRTEVADAMRERFIALADVYEDAEIERF
jgi:type I restriction enzyme R subunit